MVPLRLVKLEVQGFRSFGAGRQTVDLADTVTTVWGANSQGKSSLAEGVEFLLTGATARRDLVASAKDEFADSLRNAHIAPTVDVFVEATFTLPDGTPRRLKRVLTEDYKGSAHCGSRIEIDGNPCTEADVEVQIGLRLLPPPLRAPVLAQHTLAYVFSAAPTERAAYFRAVLDTQDLEDFRNAVEGLKSKLIAPQPPELAKLAVVETIPEVAATVGGLRKAKSPTDLEKALARALATLLTALGVTAKGSLKDGANQLDAILEGRRKQAFPLALFGRKAFVAWPGLSAETSATLSNFDRERLGVDAETRRLTVLFEAVLSLPEVEHAHDPQDCPVCGTASALTPPRVGHIRRQVEANAAYQAATKAATQLLSDVDGRLLALSQMVAQALPKFAQMTAANRRKEHFSSAKSGDWCRIRHSSMVGSGRRVI